MTGLSGGPRIIPLRLRPQYHPAPYRPRLAQNPFVEVKPQVSVPISAPISAPINIELGGLPLSIGLFAGAGLAFLVQGSLSEGWPKTTALITGTGLAVGGIVNLLLPKKASPPAAPAAPAAPPAPPPPPSGAVSSGEKAPGFTPPSMPAFANVQVEMTSPDPDQEISHTGTFLGIGSPKIPVQLRLYNPMDEAVTLNFEFEWDEYPSIIGYNRASNHGSQTFQVTLGPKEERNETFPLPIISTGWTTLSVALSLYKKRTPDENRLLIMTRTFSVT